MVCCAWKNVSPLRPQHRRQTAPRRWRGSPWHEWVPFFAAYKDFMGYCGRENTFSDEEKTARRKSG
jgi:hypothetical protein